jgi:hypothetical protein
MGFRGDAHAPTLMAWSVRPGTRLTMNDQYGPSSATAFMMAASSSSDQSPFFTSGARWWYQRSRHCLPDLPCRPFASLTQPCGPLRCTILIRARSSSSAHARLALALCSSSETKSIGMLSSALVADGVV